MPRYSTNFYLTPADCLEIVIALGETHSFSVFRCGNYPLSSPPPCYALNAIPKLGTVKVGEQSQANNYLVLQRCSELAFEKFVSTSGEPRISITQVLNPISVVFRPGGRFNEEAIIAGSVGTISDVRASIDMFQLFRKVIQRHCKKIREYYVGKEALLEMRRGVRLTASLQAPAGSDLCED